MDCPTDEESSSRDDRSAETERLEDAFRQALGTRV
jgi:hypothetical protein